MTPRAGSVLRPRCRRGEEGSVSILTAAVLFLAAALALIAVDLMRAEASKARAQTAADAAALAAAQEIAIPSAEGSPGNLASEYAQRNGATLIECRCDPGTSEAVVEVEVPVTLVFVGPNRTVRAWARAVVEGSESG